jgi:hypothetical protein
MQYAPPPELRAPGWCHRIAAFAALSLLSACGTFNGDFGEVRSTFLRDDMHDWLSKDPLAAHNSVVSSFELTDEEHALRDLAFPLIEAPYDRQQWYSAFAEYNELVADPRIGFNRAEYARRLLHSHYRSPTAKYARLNDDIQNDITRLPQFFETAARVLDVDEKRRVSLSYVTDLNRKERDNALKRIHENAAIVAQVREKLAQRVSSYRFALERMVITVPSPRAVDVERALNQLQAQIEYYRTHSAPGWMQEQSLAAAR